MKRGAEVYAMEVGDVAWPIWIGVVCGDFENQRRFYRDVLGMTEIDGEEGWVWFQVGTTSSNSSVGARRRSMTDLATRSGSLWRTYTRRETN